MNSITIRNVDTVSTESLVELLESYFDQDIPAMPPDSKLYNWKLAQSQMVYYSNTFSFLCGLSAKLKVAIRRLKKSDPDYPEMASKRDIIEESKDAIKAKYDGLSRVFTVEDSERKISGGGRV